MRARAAKLLGLSKVKAAGGALLDALKHDPDPSVRYYAAWALGEISGKKLITRFDFTDDERVAAIKGWQELFPVTPTPIPGLFNK